MGYKKSLKEELQVLGNNTKGKFFLKNFRRANYYSKSASKFEKMIGLPYRMFYKVVFNYILGTDIPEYTRLGYGFNVFHGQGLVVSGDTVIGSNVTIRQNTTIGNSRPDSKCPVIGNNVDIGANVVIIGDIAIGNNVIIAAGSVVIKDVPDNVMVAGNPSVIKRTLA